MQETKLPFKMEGLLFNKFKGDNVRVLLVRELRELLRALREISLQVKKELLSVITIRVKGIWKGSALNLRGQGILHDPGVADVQATQTTSPLNVAFQTDDLDAYDSDCDDISSAKAVLIANLSSYDSDILSDVPHHDTYQNDDMINQSVQEMRQAFWLPFSNPKSEQSDVTQTPVEIEVPKELLKITSFKDFENGLHSELNEVKTVFNQMEAVIEQCSVDKKYFNIQKKELSLDKDRLLDHIIYQDVMNNVMHDNSVLVNVLSANHKCLVDGNLESERLNQENDNLFELLLSQDIVHICVNSLATLTNYAKMKQEYIDEYSENLVLKAELAKKEQMVEKKFFDEVVLRCSRLESPKLDAKYVLIANFRKHIESFKSKNVVEKDATPNKDKENAENLQELVEHARALTPLDYACKIKSSTSASRSQPSGDTKNNRISQTTSSNMKNKVEDNSRSIKSNSNKTNRVSEPDCNNENVKHTMLNANSKLICVKCNQCMFDANHDLCFLKFVNDVNVRSKSKSTKSSKRKNTWKPTGKVFTDIDYRWKPTGRTFTIVGNTCPLTRITSNKVEPLKETTSKSKTTPNPEIKIYRRKTKVAKLVDLSSKPSILGSRPSNISEPNKHWGSTVSNSSSASLFYFRKLDLSYLHVFGALCYPINDSEDLGKSKPKADIEIFVGYAPAKKAYRIYNKRTRLIIETLHVEFDELTAMAFKQFSSGPGPQLLTPGIISSGLVPNPPSPTSYVPPTKKDYDTLFQPMFDEYFNPPPSVASPVPVVVTPDPADSITFLNYN
ncbi:retrovirus-related pol polyprotein from transposon TNT 1-94 [Tanacetum coccineum]|uniref:Retrovirus-related pol polyprotein from transposon TNT 1-94 n=1 Tax=Tanacetum coccineum TaxID=301880 RepID=A0ABQ4ZJU5_9ASTR